MRSYLSLLLFLLVSPLLSGQEQLSRLSVSGNQFVNAEGEKVVLRGFNTSDPDKLANDGHWNLEYFQEIADWGATVVRFPVHPSRLRNRGQAEYLKLLDQGIDWAGQLGMYVIIDWHSIGNLRSELYQHPMYDTDQTETFRFWTLMAKRYGGNPTVAFYELFNEPTTYRGQLGTCSWEQWKAIMEETIIIIRAHGGEGIPLVAGFNWAYDLTPMKFSPIAAENIGYVAHPYPQKREAPWVEEWTADWGFIKDHYPLVLTEIGFVKADEEGAHVPVIGDETYGDAITKYCDERDISYLPWVFDPDWDPGLISDWAFTPTRHGRYFKVRFRAYPKN
jgi:endoglucanase